MKQYEDLHNLFEKAAHEPVQISFDETKSAFLSAVSSGGLNGSGKRFWTQNRILMISTIATVTMLSSLFFLSPSTEPKQAQTTTQTPQNDVVEQPAKQNIQTVHTEPSAIREQQTSSIRSKRLTPKVLELSTAMGLQPVMTAAAYPVRQKHAFQSPYRFPELTEEEKKANEKRKKEMVKNFVKLDKNSYTYIPSSSFLIDTQRVSVQAFYIQKHEVTNIQYKTFLFDLLIHNRKDDFLAAKPDQKKWTELYGEGMKPMTNSYFAEDAYNEYPVVNVSRKGAEMYCVWLTQQVHQYTEKHDKPYFNDIRLPQRAEWIYAAAGGDTSMVYPIGRDSLKNESGCYLANFLPDSGNYADDGGFQTVKVDSYIPNVFGLYNMAGNVAEMVYENAFDRGLPSKTDNLGTAGGSWENGSEALKILGPDPYSGVEGAHPAIGFRVVATHLRRD